MQFFYRGYAHDENEVTVAVASRTERTVSGLPIKRVTTYTIRGRKIGTPAQITSQMADLVDAYSYDGGDFVGLDDDGQATYYRLISADTLGGVRVMQIPTIPAAQGADYATKIDYEIILEAQYQLSFGNAFDDFSETIAIEGGGPLLIVVDVVEGDPIEQIITEKTQYIGRQVGTATSYSPNVQVPRPLFPSKRVTWKNPAITRFLDNSSQIFRYRYSWDYEFRSATPFN